jgi:hypothetical protein
MHRIEIGRAGNTERQNGETDRFPEDNCARWIPMGRRAETEALVGLVFFRFPMLPAEPGAGTDIRMAEKRVDNENWMISKRCMTKGGYNG